MKTTAKRLGVPTSTYRDWEYGRKVPAENISQLAHIFDISISDLLGKPHRHENDLFKAASLLEEALRIIKIAI